MVQVHTGITDEYHIPKIGVYRQAIGTSQTTIANVGEIKVNNVIGH